MKILVLAEKYFGLEKKFAKIADFRLFVKGGPRDSRIILDFLCVKIGLKRTYVREMRFKKVVEWPFFAISLRAWKANGPKKAHFNLVLNLKVPLKSSSSAT